MKRFFLLNLIILFTGIAYAQGQSYKLSFSPGAGDKYDFVTDMTSSINQTINGQDMEIKMNYLVNMKYDIVSAGENKDVKITYDKLKIGVNAMGQSVSMNSDGEDKESRAVKALAGSVITVTIQPDGRVQNINGTKEIMEKMGGQSAQEKEMLDGLIGEDALKSMLEQSFRFYPAQPVEAGDSWTTIFDLKKPFPLSTTNKFTLTKVEGGKGFLNVATTLTSGGRQKTEAKGMEMFIDFTGDYTGTMEVDMATGMPVTGNGTQTLSGAVEVMGQHIPMTMKNNIKTTATKK